MNSVNTDRIKDGVSAIDVCRHYGIEVDRSGFTRCPFHNEKTASMKVYGGRRGYYCFGCHKGGDVINLVQGYFGLQFMDAARKLNTDFNLGLDIDAEQPKGRAALNAAKARYLQEREARAEQKRREAERKKLWTAWGDAISEYLRLYRLTQEARNAQTLEDLTDDMIYALKNIDAAAYDLTYAETMLRNFDGPTP